MKLTNILKPFLEPVQPDPHDTCVDEDRIREHGEHIGEALLVRLDGIHVYTAHKGQPDPHGKMAGRLDSRIQSRLRTCTAGEEEGIDIGHIGAEEYNDGEDENHSNYVTI